MENIVMRYFRETYGHTPTEIAKNLGISLKEYQEIETGQLLLSESQAEQLALLFNPNSDFLLKLSNSLTYLNGTLKAVPSHKAYIFIKNKP